MNSVSTFCHTHWDYEWYFSENESLMQLLYHMDDVIAFLEKHLGEVYVLDGQLAILEDYLQYVPESLKKIKKLVNEKRLIIGPWYTQTDELIISGESIVRNLQIGISEAKKIGDYMPIGYLPDSFGQGINMPKIYNGFDFKYSIFWRGVDDNQVAQREFVWTSGTDSVLCYNIKNGYFYGGEIWTLMEDIDNTENTFLKKCATNSILLPIGSDQRAVDKNYHSILDFYNKNSGQCQYKEESPLVFMQNLEKQKDILPKVSGEFIQSMDSKIHHSIYSSRYDHKYLQDKIERRMINQLEPLTVLLNEEGINIKENALIEIWKILLRCQAHDSACGCNTDKTNSIILSRMEKADQQSYSYLDYIIRQYAETLKSLNKDDIVVVNTLGFARNVNQTLLINTKLEHFDLISIGNNYEYTILSKERVYSGVFSNDESTYDSKLYYYQYKIALNLDLKAYEKLILKVVDSNNTHEVSTLVTGNKIENEYYCLSFDNRFSLLLKNKNIILDNFLMFEDDGDEGDTYDYSPMDLPTIKLEYENPTITTFNGKYQKMIVEGIFNLPKDELSRKLGKIDQKVNYKLEIILDARRIDFNVNLLNTCKDHRLRAIMKSHIASDYSFADTAFGVIKREIHPACMINWKNKGYKEEPTPIYPMLNLCGLENNGEYTLVCTKGIKEYEMEEDNIALTLFRSVGFLGKADLKRRPGAPSGNQFKIIPTPDSQLLKNLKFKFSYTIDNNFSESKVIRTMQNYVTTFVYYQKQNYNRFTNTLKYFSINCEETRSLNNFKLSIDNEKVYITSLMMHGNNYMLRIKNSSDTFEKITLILNKNYDLFKVNMLGEKKNKLSNIIELKPEQLMTILIKTN